MTHLLLASVQAALLAIVIWLLHRALGDALSPRVRSAMWWVVLLRLVLPLPLPDPFGIERPSWWTWPATTTTAIAAIPEPGTDVEPTSVASLLGTAPPGHGLADAPARSAKRATPDTVDPRPRGQRARADDPGAARLSAPPVPRDSTTAQATRREAADLLLWGWVGGTFLLLLRAVRGEAAFRRRILRSAMPAPADAVALLDACRRSLGVRRKVSLVRSANLSSPAVHGVVRPTILLPTDAWASLDDAARAFVLRHELAHVRHHDSAVNLALTVVRAVHWFNPFAAVAAGALRDERELLRDAEAVNAIPALDADRCARSVLALSRADRSAAHPHHPSLATLAPTRSAAIRRRLEMIVRERPFQRAPALFGIGCCAVLSWAGLSAPLRQATPATPPAALAAAPAGMPQEPIRVVRQAPIPEWEAPLAARLSQPVQWPEALALTALARSLGEQAGVQISVDPQHLEDLGEDPTVLPLLAPVRLDDALDLVCWSLGQTGSDWLWRGVRGGVRLESPDDARRTELRFYDVSRLLRANPEPEWLMDLVRSQLPDWDDEWATLELWRERLLIRQTARIHERIEAFLGQLATGRDPARDEVPAPLRAKLETPIQWSAEGPPADLLLALAARHGIPLFIDPELDQDPIDVSVDGEPLSRVLAEVTRDYPITIYRGAIVVGAGVPLVTRVFDIADLVTVSEQDIEEFIDGEEELRAEAVQEIQAEKRKRLADLVMSHVEPSSWDGLDGAGVSFWGDRMLVAQIEPVHASVRSFLETARRSLGD